MPPSPSFYPWPASALTPEDMCLLHHVRENGPEHIPITRLIAHAVREQYGTRVQPGSADGEESMPCAA